MREFSSIPNGISHKDLTSLLARSIKGQENINSYELSSKEIEELHCLLDKWLIISKQIIESLKKNKSQLLQNMSPSKVMALGAFQAHLLLSIQAKMFFEED